MLRSGAYRVGDRLPSEPELGAELGVSRSTVREAVRELTSLGVLEIQHGRGTFVRSLRPDLLLRGDSLLDHGNDRIREELLEVRGIVEPEAAALAAERASEEDVGAPALRRRAPRRSRRPWRIGARGPRVSSRPGTRHPQRRAVAGERRDHLVLPVGWPTPDRA